MCFYLVRTKDIALKWPSLCSVWSRRQRDVRLTQCVTVTDSERICAFFCREQSSHLLWILRNTKLDTGRAASVLWWFNKIPLSSTCVLARGFPFYVIHCVAASFALEQGSLLTLCCCFHDSGCTLSLALHLPLTPANHHRMRESLSHGMILRRADTFKQSKSSYHHRLFQSNLLTLPLTLFQSGKTYFFWMNWYSLHIRWELRALGNEALRFIIFYEGGWSHD